MGARSTMLLKFFHGRWHDRARFLTFTESMHFPFFLKVYFSMGKYWYLQFVLQRLHLDDNNSDKVA
jgi:hypothetical protein